MLLALIVAVVLAGSWLVGKRQGEREAAIIASQRLSSVEAQNMIFSLQAQLREKEMEAVANYKSAQTAAARALKLQGQLDELMRRSLSDTSDLALYRRIETGQDPRGVVVESVRWNELYPEDLELTLIQWRGRNRVKGELRVTLNYSHAEHNLTNQLEQPVAENMTSSVELTPLAFDFRFFQKFNVAMIPQILSDNPEESGFQLPESLDIRITSPDKSLKVVNTRILWSDVSE